MKKSPISNQSVQLISNPKNSLDDQNISITYNKLIGSNKISNGGNSSNNITTNSSSNNNFGSISPSIANLSPFSNRTNPTEKSEYSPYPARGFVAATASRSPRVPEAILQSSETLIPQKSPMSLLLPHKENCQPSSVSAHRPTQNIQFISAKCNAIGVGSNGNSSISGIPGNSGNDDTFSSKSASNDSQSQCENECMPSLSFLANLGQPLIRNVSPKKATPLILPSNDNRTFAGAPYANFVLAPEENICDVGGERERVGEGMRMLMPSSATISVVPSSITPSSFQLTSPFGIVPCIDLNENVGGGNIGNGSEKANDVIINDSGSNGDVAVENSNDKCLRFMRPEGFCPIEECVRKRDSSDGRRKRKRRKSDDDDDDDYVDEEEEDEESEDYDDDDDEYEMGNDGSNKNEKATYERRRGGDESSCSNSSSTKRNFSSKKIRGPRNNDFIQDSRKRGASFCKRRDGLIKKFCEITKLTETEGFILIRSPTGMLFWGATPQMERVAQMKDVSKYFLSQAPPPVPRKVRRPNKSKK